MHVAILFPITQVYLLTLMTETYSPFVNYVQGHGVELERPRRSLTPLYDQSRLSTP